MAFQPHNLSGSLQGGSHFCSPVSEWGGLDRLVRGVWILSTGLQTLEPYLGRQGAERKHV